MLSLTVLFTICLLQTDLHAERISDEVIDQDWIMAGWGGALAGTWYDDEGMYDFFGNWIEGKFAGASPYAFFWNLYGKPVKCYYSDFAKLSNNKGTKFKLGEHASEGWVSHDEWFVDSNYYHWEVTEEHWGGYDIENECKLELKEEIKLDGVRKTVTIHTFKAVSKLSFDLE